MNDDELKRVFSEQNDLQNNDLQNMSPEEQQYAVNLRLAQIVVAYHRTIVLAGSAYIAGQALARKLSPVIKIVLYPLYLVCVVIDKILYVFAVSVCTFFLIIFDLLKKVGQLFVFVFSTIARIGLALLTAAERTAEFLKLCIYFLFYKVIFEFFIYNLIWGNLSGNITGYPNWFWVVAHGIIFYGFHKVFPFPASLSVLFGVTCPPVPTISGIDPRAVFMFMETWRLCQLMAWFVVGFIWPHLVLFPLLGIDNSLWRNVLYPAFGWEWGKRRFPRRRDGRDDDRGGSSRPRRPDRDGGGGSLVVSPALVPRG